MLTFCWGKKHLRTFFLGGFQVISLGVVLKVTLFFLLSGKLTNIPWKIVVGNWKTILSFWKGRFLGDTISFFFQNNPFKGSTWYLCLWMVSSRDPKSMAANVSNPMFGDKKMDREVFRTCYNVIINACGYWPWAWQVRSPNLYGFWKGLLYPMTHPCMLYFTHI